MVVKRDNLPSEKMGVEYNQEVMTRFAEEVVANIKGNQQSTGQNMAKMLELLTNQQAQFDAHETAQNQGPASDSAPSPKPEVLEAYKVPGLPIVIAWCKPINPMKFPNTGGFQFFASLVHNFIPLEESGEVTFTGTASNTHATVLSICATESTKIFKAGTSSNLQFFTEMSAGNSKQVTNTTTGDTGSTSSWLAATPKNVTTDIAWTDGDGYSLTTWMPKNLIGQGPLPFAVFFIPNWIGNPGWDKESVYVKARTYTKRKRSYSFFETASTTGNDGETLDAPTVTATPIFWNGNIKITWTKGTTPKDWFDELDHYDLYRTTANSTAMLTESNILWSGKGFLNVYTDIGYHATNSPNGPEADKTYYYWAVCVNKEGDNGTFSTADPATLASGGTVTIYAGTEDETKSIGWGKHWNIFWYDDGDSEGYWVRFRKNISGGGYGLYSIPIYIKHTTDNGTHASGYYIQQHTFKAMVIGEAYEFSVLATNNPLVPNLAGAWVTQEYTITDSVPPDTPT